MHHYRPLLLIPVFALSTLAAKAQDLTEALNLSNVTVQGTARSMGFGNALGSVGADLGTTSVNPAGLGIYRTSELTFTPSLRINSATSQYLGSSTPDNNVHFNINNFGIVLTNAPKGKRYERRNWKVVSFAFGMNRVADFNRNYSYRGTNHTSSGTQAFEADANRYPGDATNQYASYYPGYMGYQSFLIDTTDPSFNHFASTVPFGGGIDQKMIVKERGRIDEYVISLGGNYMEKLMIGGTLGLTSMKYNMQSTYSEQLSSGNTAPNPKNFQSYVYNQSLDLSGGGLNLKLGGIYKITDEIRVGAAFHSPTIYSITDVYTPRVNANVVGGNYEVSVANGYATQNQFDYSFITPWHGVLSATYIVKNVGFITADYEYVGFNSMKYIYPEFDGSGNSYQGQEDAMNSSIKNVYQGASNFRIGAEGLLSKFFMARAGFGYYGNPYKAATNLDGSRIDISGGLGFRTKNFFADVALVYRMYKEEFQPYTVDYNYVLSGPSVVTPTATTDLSSANVAFTVGVKF